MRWAQVRDWILPGRVEQDESFRQEIYSLSYRGARVVAGVELVVAGLAFAGWMPLWAAIAILVLAAITFAVSSMASAYPHNRQVAWITSGVASVIAVRTMMAGAAMDFALGATTLLTLGAVTALPLRPVQTFSMGAAIVIAGLDTGHLWFFVILMLAASVLTANRYSQRQLYCRAYLEALQTSAELRKLQTQALRMESSATMVRLSAALAHELSSPIGVLASGIDTLISVCARQAQAPPESRQLFSQLQDELRGSLQDSLERLRKTVNRIQRLTDLDEAPTQQANLNELVREAVGLMKPQSRAGTRFELDLRPVPDVTCRPQQLIAVLCSLISNSIQAVNGQGRIAVTTGVRDSLLELRIEDNGRGIPADRLAHIFDPGFRVADGRVSTGNWSLFTSRQYIKEHGGEIRIQSLEGKGTTVWLTLPATS
jgi:signal transduction histidine kinase